MLNGESKVSKMSVSPRTIIGVAIAVIALIMVLIVSLNGSKPTVYSINNDIFKISTAYGKSIKLSDIKSIQLKNDLPSNLSRVDGYGFSTIVKGKCTSDIGNVTVYIDTSKPPYIYISTTSGLVILNDQSKLKTQSLYEKLNSDIKQ
jgi:hypothetical protein